MKSMSIKQKILLILFLSFVILLFNINNVFAVITAEDLPNMSFIDYENMPSDLITAVENIPEHTSGDYYTLFSRNAGSSYYTIYFVPKSDDLRVYVSEVHDDVNNTIVITGNNTGDCVYYRLNKDSTEPFGRTTQNPMNFWAIHMTVENCLFYSDVPIYLSNDSDTLFFHLAPVVEAPILEGTLAPIMAEIQTEEVMTEVVHLLPVILSVLVSLLALYKALKMLLDFLRTS